MVLVASRIDFPNIKIVYGKDKRTNWEWLKDSVFGLLAQQLNQNIYDYFVSNEPRRSFG